MKSIARGFSSIILILLIILILGGVYYFYLKHSSASIPASQVVSSTTSNTNVQVTTTFHPLSKGVLLSSQKPVSRSDDFTRVRFRYFFDGSSIFYAQGGVVHILPTADPKTFMVLTSAFDSDVYALDKNVVYYQGVVIPNSDPATFQVVIGGEYGVDSHAVYWDGTVIVGADVRTFTDAAGSYSEADDKNHIYCFGNPYPRPEKINGTECENVSPNPSRLKPLAQ